MSKLFNFSVPFFLFSIAIATFFPLLSAQYLYDDLIVIVIVSNPHLREIQSVADCFSFNFKASRPVADFFLAFGELITKGHPAGQRILSLLLHGLNSILVFLILRNLLHGSNIGRILPILISILFSIHPIHSETIAIAQYRMELLGSFFTLCSILLGLILTVDGSSSLKAKSLWSLLFLSLGGAALSKEVFLLVTPIAVWLCTSLSGTHLNFLKRLASVQLFWTVILLSLLVGDSNSAQPYQDLLGYDRLSPLEHIQLSARALLVGLKQIISAQGFTFTRLIERRDAFSQLPITISVLILIGFITIGLILFHLRGFYRISLGVFFIFSALYFFIPNINIGSEHYWYLSTLGILSFIAYSICQFFNRYTSKPKFFLVLSTLPIGLFFFTASQHRLTQMQTRLSLYNAELKTHPESVSSWINYAASLIESPDAAIAQSARPYLDQARKMDPNNIILLNNEFMYSVKMKDFKSAELLLSKIRSIFLSQPRKLSSFYLFLLDAAIDSNECSLALTTKREFDILNPASEDKQKITKSLEETCRS